MITYLKQALKDLDTYDDLSETGFNMSRYQ